MMECGRTNRSNGNSACLRRERMKQESQRNCDSMDAKAAADDLWKDGLICAFEYVRDFRKPVNPKPGSKVQSVHSSEEELKKGTTNKHTDLMSQKIDGDDLRLSSPLGDYDNRYAYMPHYREHNEDVHIVQIHGKEGFQRSYWAPIGWNRISEHLQTLQVNNTWDSQPIDFLDDEDEVTVADVVAPYWERPVGPTWWCHVQAGHPFVNAWLSSAQWLHPAISVALRDESKLISERMKHLFYEVPVRVAGGLLFELLGQSAGDPFVDEDDIPIVLRSWQARNFLITTLHVKGSASKINVLGISEIQEMLAAGGTNMPRTVHELIAHLACRLARWDDRLFRKSIFGAADEIELKFVDRRTHEDMHLLSIILNQEIRRLSTQVIRVKWSLHAREEIVFELLQHLRGNVTRVLLEGIRKSTRQMIEEQEAVRGRLFTIQDVMQSTVRAWLQDKSLRVTHNLGVFGGCGLVLSIITGLFGINVDGIPGAQGAPYAFALFSGLLFLLGFGLIAIGLIYLGLKRPIHEEDVEVRKLELEELVKMFQKEAESHAQVRKSVPRSNLTPTAANLLADGTGYVLIS